MSGINVAVFSGRLCSDPEVRSTKNGTPVVNMRIAIPDSKKDPQTGDREDFAHFVTAFWYGDRAVSFARYLRKGSSVTVQASIAYREWESNGQRRSAVEFKVEDLADHTPKGASLAPAASDEDVPF